MYKQKADLKAINSVAGNFDPIRKFYTNNTS
jgi:hypothetical protein